MSEQKEEEQKNTETKPGEPAQDKLVETHHKVTINGQVIPYTVTCGTLVLKEEAEKEDKPGAAEGERPRAAIFFIAYTREDVEDKATRPVTFSFNGGPGSASVWMHLGLLGPKRVLMDDAGMPLPPPYKLVENEYSLLDVTDLVFIDPVGTGFSRMLPGEQTKQYHGFKKDIESVGDFIRLYVTRYARWASPKYLIGESYGTTRAAGLSGYLQDRHSLYLNGIALVSAVLNFQTLEFEIGNELPYILFLPTYTATAWYHHRLPPALQERPLAEVLKEVETFAINEYTPALMRGADLPANERSQLAERLAGYTGLSADYVERTELRIEIFRFVRELLRDERRTVGRIDSRYKGIERDAAGERMEYDPSIAATIGPYAATFNQYVRAELKFESDLPYEVLTERVHPWSFREHENKYVQVAETLRGAMSANPHLKVFVASGYYDLATPYFATIYTFNHLLLDPSLQGNLSMGFYEAGHMMYVHKESLAKIKADLTRWYLPE